MLQELLRPEKQSTYNKGVCQTGAQKPSSTNSLLKKSASVVMERPEIPCILNFKYLEIRWVSAVKHSYDPSTWEKIKGDSPTSEVSASYIVV